MNPNNSQRRRNPVAAAVRGQPSMSSSQLDAAKSHSLPIVPDDKT